MLFLHQVQQGFCFIYSPSFSVAGVGPFDIDLHFAWQVWHFCTSTVLLRGRRGTLWHGWNESNSHTRRFFVLVSLWNAFFFQSLAPVSKFDVCVYGGVSMRCFILCSKVMQNGCVLKWCLRVCSKVILLPIWLGFIWVDMGQRWVWDWTWFIELGISGPILGWLYRFCICKRLWYLQVLFISLCSCSYPEAVELFWNLGGVLFQTGWLSLGHVMLTVDSDSIR